MFNEYIKIICSVSCCRGFSYFILKFSFEVVDDVYEENLVEKEVQGQPHDQLDQSETKDLQVVINSEDTILTVGNITFRLSHCVYSPYFS